MYGRTIGARHILCNIYIDNPSAAGACMLYPITLSYYLFTIINNNIIMTRDSHASI